jgi:hypothetical protein
MVLTTNDMIDTFSQNPNKKNYIFICKKNLQIWLLHDLYFLSHFYGRLEYSKNLYGHVDESFKPFMVH